MFIIYTISLPSQYLSQCLTKQLDMPPGQVNTEKEPHGHRPERGEDTHSHTKINMPQMKASHSKVKGLCVNGDNPPE